VEVSSSDVVLESSIVQGEVKSDRARKAAIIVTIFLVILIVGIFAASRYQPIEISGLLGIDHPGTHEVVASQEFAVKNTGPLGVTVVDMKSGRLSVSNEDSRVAPARMCPYTPRHSFDCSQSDGTGLLVGVKFHPFGLATDDARPIFWLYQYPCGSSTTSGVQEGVLTLPVTYRFLWFKHTILFSEVTNVTATCSSK
jgi:hypothetical protein